MNAKFLLSNCSPGHAHAIQAVCLVHIETSTGCTTQVSKVRQAIDAAAHPALLLVDTISGLAFCGLPLRQVSR